jgi:Zn-dependent peptidase ImmA (M78 family)
LKDGILAQTISYADVTRVSTIEKGDRLEDAFHAYLCDQQERGSLVYDAYSSDLCKIYKKKGYYCAERKRDIVFDVVIELFRKGRDRPHSYVVFECKNHTRAIQERDVTDFSDKIGRLFQNAIKGVVVVSSSLQSGAENVARNRKMGIVKFAEHGLEVIADRKSRSPFESEFVRSQITRTEHRSKSLKFAAYFDGHFLSSIDQFLACIDLLHTTPNATKPLGDSAGVPYLTDEEIERSTSVLLQKTGYQSGPTDLERACSVLSINLTRTEQVVLDDDGSHILGSANFDRRSILVNDHKNKHRERFTVAHEIGHFCLNYDKFFRSETIVEQDLVLGEGAETRFFMDRLEHQANLFASALLLPEKSFRDRVSLLRKNWGIVDKGHGYIFVDDQPCNFEPYSQFVSDLSSFFDVSVQAIEVRLRKMGLLTDQRRNFKRK